MKRRNFLAAPLAGLAWLVGIRAAKRAVGEKTRVAPPLEGQHVSSFGPSGDDFDLEDFIQRLREKAAGKVLIQWCINEGVFSKTLNIGLSFIERPPKPDLAKNAPEA